MLNSAGTLQNSLERRKSGAKSMRNIHQPDDDDQTDAQRKSTIEIKLMDTTKYLEKHLIDNLMRYELIFTT